MKARYLLQFSYIGTHFRSSEKIWLKGGRNFADPMSIQGIIEIGLQKLRSINYPNLVLSSRTDGGVHALNSAAHCDLDRHGPSIYDGLYVAKELNKYFFKNELPVIIKKCTRVPDDFNARFNAKSRTYLFRLAVIKKGIQLPENTFLSSLIPVEEWNKCLFLRYPDLNIEKFKEGCKYFVGYHDFSTFRKQDKQNPAKSNRRRIYSIDVNPGRPLVTSHTVQQDSSFDYWDVFIHGKSFVHNQIRRMIGALISVAKGKLQPEEIKVMLQIPSKHSWPSFIECVPPSGLYLCNVEYDPADLIYDPNKNCKSSDDLETHSEENEFFE